MRKGALRVCLVRRHGGVEQLRCAAHAERLVKGDLSVEPQLALSTSSGGTRRPWIAVLVATHEEAPRHSASEVALGVSGRPRRCQPMSLFSLLVPSHTQADGADPAGSASLAGTKHSATMLAVLRL